MAATNFTPISLYYTTTAAAAPTAGNLVNGELAINITDGKLYYKDNSGVVQLLASKAALTSVDSISFGTTGLTPSTATTGAVTVAGTLVVSNGGTGLTSLTAGYIPYGNGTSAFGSSANLFWDSANSRMYLGGATSIPLTTTAITPLSIIGQALIGTSNATVSANKDFRILGGAYTNNAATIINFSGQSGANTINYGGATGAGEPATTHAWYTGTIGTAGAGSERMRVTETGRLGVGTSSPGATIHSSGTDATYPLGVTGTTKGFRVVTSSTDTKIQGVDSTLSASYQPLGLGGSYLTFETNGSAEAMRITSTGNVAIGQTTASARLTSQAASFGDALSGSSSVPFYGKTGGAATSVVRNILVADVYTADASLRANIQIPFLNRNNSSELGGSIVFTNDLALAFRTGQSGALAAETLSGTERMRIDSSGNVGIGTSSPAYKLHVSAASGIAAGFDRGDGSPAIIDLRTSGTTRGYLGATTSVPFIVYNATPTELMRLDSSGNLGLGVTPSAWNTAVAFAVGNGGLSGTVQSGSLDIVNNVYFNGSSYLYRTTNFATFTRQTATGQHLWYTAPSGTAGAVASFTQAMTLNASGNLSVGTTVANSRLTVQGNSTVQLFDSTGGNQVDLDFPSFDVFRIRTYYATGSTMTFATNPNGGGNTERMRITSTGDVGIGTTSPSQKLDVAGSLSLGSGSTSAIFTRIWTAAGFSYYGTEGAAGGVIATGTTPYFNVIRSPSGYGTQIAVGSTVCTTFDGVGNALFAKAVRATITTDNDLSFDMNAASNFKSTLSAGGALTFTNITSGQTGNIILVNGSNYAITAAATTKVSSTCLATISATGTYWLSYYSDGTNVYVANTGALA